MTEANQRFQSGDYQSALKLYSRGLEISRTNDDTLNAACFLAGVGNYYVVAHLYREALAAFDIAAQDALKAKYVDFALRLAVNRATLYRRMGEKQAALEAMRAVRDIIPDEPPAWLLIQAGNLAADSHGIDAAASYFLAASDRAASEGDVTTQSYALGQLGYFYLSEGNLQAAEDALARAFRLRKLSGNKQLGSLYFHLGMLRLAQGDPDAAFQLLSMSLAPASGPMPIPPASIYYERARALDVMGKLQDAAPEYELAIQSATDWRLHVVPSDTFRISADVSLQEIYSGYVNLAMRMYRQTGSAMWARRAFNAAEANRAASLQESLEQRLLPPEYWEDVARLRSAVGPKENSHQKKERNTPDLSLSLQEDKLAEDEALLSFYVADEATYLWAITRRTFESHVLPGRKDLTAMLASFRHPGDARTPIADSGAAIRSALFEKLSSTVQQKKAWILSLDDTLHGFPFSALPEAGDSGQVMAQTRSIRVVPNSAMIATPASRPLPNRFVAFADPVYNGADPRWSGAVVSSTVQLSRLPGTRREAMSSFSSWGADSATTLLTGKEITAQSIQKVTSEPAAVFHFGTHIVPAPGAPGSVAIALGLNASGTGEYLTAPDIAKLRSDSGIVVLSGCGSGTGKSLAGAGLIGLTRAWLLAGAQSVAATYWPITDDAQAFFSSFYKHLRARAGAGITASAAAAALREAQVEMIRGGGAHARPEYWAAFFIVGKD